MKKTLKRDQITSNLFDLTDEGAKFRIKWRRLAGMAIWLTLSGLTMILTVFSAQEQIHKLTVIAMSLVKYIPLMLVVYSLSRKMAAKYLNDVYELNNEELASDFLEHVAFNQIEYTTVYDKDKGKVVTKPVQSPLITIKDGEITETDEHSPLILIGGPGFIQVNLDSVAMLEKVTGESEVVFPRKDAWRLGSFERIREIGDSDEVGEREYAIINLREQIVRIPSIKSRTKDGIPVEARDIKITFSVLRRQESKHTTAPNGETFLFDEHAIQALVYKQTTITPEPPDLSDAGFPWSTTIIPLVISEIEQVITSHTANEILASIGQKEMDLITKAEQTAAQMRVEITGKQQAYTDDKKGAPSKSLSRSMVTEQFYQARFTEKATAIGVQLNWIDIGTWEPSGPIRDKIRNAWKIAVENIKKHGLVEKWKKEHTDTEMLNLIDNVVISFSERINARSGGKEKEKQMVSKDLENLVAKNPELLSNSFFMERFTQNDLSKKNTAGTAPEMLKAFRKELLAGQELIEEKEKVSAEQKHADLERIEKTLNIINTFFPHP